MINNDSAAFVSLHLAHAFAKYRVGESSDTDSLEYIVGGMDGTWPIVDLNGSTYPPGTTVWEGQREYTSHVTRRAV